MSNIKSEVKLTFDQIRDIMEPGPFVVSGFKHPTLGNAMAVWPAAQQPNKPGRPICLVCPLDVVTDKHKAHAALLAAAPLLFDFKDAVIGIDEYFKLDGADMNGEKLQHVLALIHTALEKSRAAGLIPRQPAEENFSA